MRGRAAPGSAASHRARATLMAVFDPQIPRKTVTVKVFAPPETFASQYD